MAFKAAVFVSPCGPTSLPHDWHLCPRFYDLRNYNTTIELLNDIHADFRIQPGVDALRLHHPDSCDAPITLQQDICGYEVDRLNDWAHVYIHLPPRAPQLGQNGSLLSQTMAAPTAPLKQPYMPGSKCFSARRAARLRSGGMDVALANIDVGGAGVALQAGEADPFDVGAAAPVYPMQRDFNPSLGLSSRPRHDAPKPSSALGISDLVRDLVGTTPEQKTPYKESPLTVDDLPRGESQGTAAGTSDAQTESRMVRVGTRSLKQEGLKTKSKSANEVPLSIIVIAMVDSKGPVTYGTLYAWPFNGAEIAQHDHVSKIDFNDEWSPDANLAVAFGKGQKHFEQLLRAFIHPVEALDGLSARRAASITESAKSIALRALPIQPDYVMDSSLSPAPGSRLNDRISVVISFINHVSEKKIIEDELQNLQADLEHDEDLASFRSYLLTEGKTTHKNKKIAALLTNKLKVAWDINVWVMPQGEGSTTLYRWEQDTLISSLLDDQLAADEGYTRSLYVVVEVVEKSKGQKSDGR